MRAAQFRKREFDLKPKLYLRCDSIVDRMAKCLAPEGCINWHIYREQARSVLLELEIWKENPRQLEADIIGEDRPITHEELAAYKAYLAA